MVQYHIATLIDNKIPALTGIDTRKLTNLIRNKGARKGTIQFLKSGKHNIKELKKTTKKWSGLLNLDLAKKVSCKVPISDTPTKDHAIVATFWFRRARDFFNYRKKLFDLIYSDCL